MKFPFPTILALGNDGHPYTVSCAYDHRGRMVTKRVTENDGFPVTRSYPVKNRV
jgi:hypothetical protein